MKYQHIVQAEFVERQNRFVAYVNLDGRREKVHVKNTGRCKELLLPGAKVYLEKGSNPARTTAYYLVAVEKEKRLVNMDSQAPNKVVEEWLYTKKLFPDLVLVRPETTYGKSRFDFYVETKNEKIFIEVKGVTLEENGVVSFPDAPSERAVKHVEELIQAQKEGYRVMVLFVIQMEGVKFFTPNEVTHKEFAESLYKAKEAGVEILAYDCQVTPDSMSIGKPVPVEIKEKLRSGELFLVPKLLLKWYDTNRRVLPWREEPTPYRVWVSEIMLQQTRVEAVKAYYERFMKRLPDIRSLAEAEEEDLLKLWEGLGYYNRVRNMQKAAKRIMEEYGGEMPDTYEELLTLEGIGSYTAGAIASIAYKRVNPAVDGNVLRVISRVRMDGRLISDAKVKKTVEEDLQTVMPTDRPGDFNQALMELGACVCIPNGAPHCDKCPLQKICMAHQAGEEMTYPKKAGSKPRTIEKKTVLVIQDENRIAIHKRPDTGLLAGMYEFPSLDGFYTAKEVCAYLEQNGMKIIRIRDLEKATHIFTHKEWHMKGFLIRVDELEKGIPGAESKNWLFIEPQNTKHKYPIPKAFAAYSKCMNIKLGTERYEEE